MSGAGVDDHQHLVTELISDATVGSGIYHK